MIEGVLQYSSVDTAETGFEKIDLNYICATILEDLELVIAEKKAEVTFSGLPVVTGSYTLIYQLLYNLINNSLKFVRDGVRPVIGISSRKAKRDELQKAGISAPDREYCRIDVADNGIGFEQSYAEKIFDSFIRLNSKDKFEGTGLGLALCKKIAGRHKGRILAHGVPGRGATFSIFLPADH
jgi:signal transduction histidine kinase